MLRAKTRSLGRRSRSNKMIGRTAHEECCWRSIAQVYGTAHELFNSDPNQSIVPFFCLRLSYRQGKPRYRSAWDTIKRARKRRSGLSQRCAHLDHLPAPVNQWVSTITGTRHLAVPPYRQAASSRGLFEREVLETIRRARGCSDVVFGFEGCMPWQKWRGQVVVGGYRYGTVHRYEAPFAFGCNRSGGGQPIKLKFRAAVKRGRHYSTVTSPSSPPTTKGKMVSREARPF